MKKRILSIILSIVMLVGLLPTTALALATHTNHCVCGAEHKSIGDHTTETIKTFEVWDNTTSLPSSGNYYLNKDVALTATANITGELNLCLNGHSISGTQINTITVSSGAVLNICDCKGIGSISGTQRGIYNTSGTVNVYGGTVSATGTGSVNDIFGVYNYSGTVNVYGGTVSATGGKNIDCGIYNNPGTVNVYGGTISTTGSSTYAYGIRNNGGAVNVFDGEVRVTNSGTYGYGIENKKSGSTVIVSGGTISTTGTESCDGYGIYNNVGTFELSGAPTITGKTADIYLNDNTVTIGAGGLTYTSDKAISVKMNTPGTFTTGWTDKMGDVAYGNYFVSADPNLAVVKDTSGELKIAEAVTVSFNANSGSGTMNNVLVEKKGTYTLPSCTFTPPTGKQFAGWAQAAEGEVISEATITVSEDITLYAVWKDAPAHSHPVCGATHSDIGNHTGACGDITWTAWDGTDKDGATDGIQLTAGSWYLTDNVTLTETLTISSGTVNLCLNGKSLNNSSDAVKVESGGTFNLCDCKGGGSVTATGTKKEGIINSGIASIYGGTVSGTLYGISNSSSSTVNVFGGIVEDTNSSSYGIANLGTVNVSGGAVNGSSRGIENMNSGGNAKVNVTGGTVTGSRYGIYNSYGCSVTVSGGTVKSTGTDGNNHGIYNYQGSLELSGVPTITGNTAGIHLAKDQAITISGALTYAEAKAISVKMNTPGTFTSGWTTKMGGNAANYGSYFTSADSTYTVQPDGNNELKLAEPPAHSHDNCGVENCEAVHNHSTVNSWTAWDGTDDFRGGDVYLTDDVTLTDTLTISSGTVNLCLNGKSITSSLSSTIQVNSGATLNICDCSTGETAGKIANACASSNGRGIYNLGTVTVYGGTIEATGDSGRGIYNGTVNIYGGTIQATGTGIYLNNGTGTVSGGTVRATGTGIYLNSGCSVTVSGGTIEATGDNGRGIDNSSGANATVSGGSISGASYGIHNGYAGSFELSGDPTITGTAADVYIGGNGAKIITITGALNYAEGNAISVEMSTPGTFTSGWNTYMTSADSSDYFTSADNGYTVQKDYSGELELAEPPTTYTVTFNANSHGTAPAAISDISSGSTITAPAAPTADGYTFGGWYKEQACTTAWDFATDTVTENTTLYAKWTANTYKVTFNANGGAGMMAEQSFTHGEAEKALTANTFTCADHIFTGWNTAANGNGTAYADGASISLTGDLTLYAQWTEVHNITGTVTKRDSGPLVGISVKLMQGNNKLAEDTTETGGVFEFNNVPLGSYNVVAEQTIDSSTKTKTELVVIEHKDVNNLSVIMPSQNVSSTLEVKENTPNIVVGGLDDEAADQTHSNAANSNTHVSIGMSITKQDDATSGGESDAKTQQDAIKGAAGDAQEDNLIFLDIKVQKTTTTGSNKTTTPITDTQTVLELIIPYDLDGKHGVTVYRYHGDNYHGDNVKVMVKISERPSNGSSKRDGTFYLDEENHLIYVYTDKFSTYAIGYNDTDVYTITLDPNGGTVGSTALTTNASGKLDSLPTPTRSGSYTFNGWYTAASGGTQVTTVTVFSSNQTIYAQWTYTGGTGGGGGDYTPTYAIIVEDAENGEAKANRSYASSGSTVTITVDPEAGYALNKLTVKDDQGNKIEVTDKGDGTYTFKMPSRKVTVTAAFATDGSYSTCPGDHTCPIWPYTDAETTAWYHDGVHYIIEKGLMTGYGNGIFKPNTDTSRAMIAVMLWRLEGSPVVNYLLDFKDVKAEAWYTEAIRWAKSEGIIGGYGNGCWGPDDAVTREQMVTILWRYAQYKGYDVSVGENTNILSYDDAFDVAEYAIPAMQWACGSGMVQGMNDPDGEGMILAPESKGTRAQIATMIMRFCEEILK